MKCTFSPYKPGEFDEYVRTQGIDTTCEICGCEMVVFPHTPEKYRRKCSICQLEGRRLPRKKR
jgi:hypothetical protein